VRHFHSADLHPAPAARHGDQEMAANAGRVFPDNSWSAVTVLSGDFTQHATAVFPFT